MLTGLAAAYRRLGYTHSRIGVTSVRLSYLAVLPLLSLSAQQSPDAAPNAAPVQAYVPTLMPLVFAKPVVPESAKEIPGWVQVLVTIDPTGAVTRAEALSGPQELRQAAIDACRRQKYRPVIRDGHAVYAYTSTRVNFMVKGKSAMENFDAAGDRQASRKLMEIETSLPRSKAQVLADLEQDAGGGDDTRRFYALPQLAKVAFTAGETDKAKAYANELLADPQHSDWNYGNAIHDGNMVLGLLAVRMGNVQGASQYLLDAGNTPGSPQLNSFGPDMSLAKALLEKGQRDAVLEYFSRCGKFWTMGKDQLDTWSETVRAGGTPDMAMNLRLGN